jgi:iron(III) transport system substrate-binding protein
LEEKDNNHVGIIYPDQQDNQMGIVNDVAAIGIIKGAQHKDAAEKFVQFLLSDEGQSMFAGLNSEVPIVKSVPFQEKGKPMSELKFANVKLEQLAAELDKTRKLIDSVGGLPIK